MLALVAACGLSLVAARGPRPRWGVQASDCVASFVVERGL